MPVFYVFILLLTSFLWGGNFVYSKFLIGHASPITLTILRWLIAIMVLFPLLLKREKNWVPSKDSILPLFLMGLSGVVFFNLFQFIALSETSALNAGLISTLNPFSIAFSSFLFLHEKIHFRQLISMAVSFLGVVIVLSKGKIDHLLAFHFNNGDLWMMAAVLMWGVYSVCGRWVLIKISPMMATFYSGLFGVFILLPFNLSSFNVENINTSFILSLLYTGIVSTVICMLLWNIGVKKVGATRAGIFLNFNPIFTAILAFFILRERLTIAELGGGILVITGCYLFSRFEESK
jgi:drug/metabolite transporter (DMT)-like permease